MFRLTLFILCFFYFQASIANTEICVVGDTGTGGEDQYKVAEAMFKANCKTILHTGDVIYDKGVSSETDLQWITKFEDPNAPLIQSGAEFYMSMGNHDHGAGKKDKIKQIHMAYANKNSFYKFFGLQYNFKLGNNCFWAVDTDSFGDDEAQEVNLSVDNANDKCDWKIFFGHHPIVSSGDHGDAKPNSFLIKNLDPILTRHADVYFAGHDHNLADEGFYPNENGFRQIISGAGAKLRAVKSCKQTGCVFVQSKLGFAKVHIKPDLMVIDFLDLNQNILHTTELKK